MHVEGNEASYGPPHGERSRYGCKADNRGYSSYTMSLNGHTETGPWSSWREVDVTSKDMMAVMPLHRACNMVTLKRHCSHRQGGRCDAKDSGRDTSAPGMSWSQLRCHSPS
jgi:hypothetical protein